MVKGIVTVFGLVIIVAIILFALWSFYNMLMGIESLRTKWQRRRARRLAERRLDDDA